MATYTDNYHLSKPETTDSQQSFIEDYATNMEIIDENMGGGSGGGGHVIIDENGAEMAQEPNMQFAGKVSVADDDTNEKTVVTLPEEVKEVTLAEYEALPDTKLSDDIAYFIKDLDNPSVEGYPPLIYSDEEREIGVWRDGKPLYQRTVEISNISYDSNWHDVAHDISNIETIVQIKGIIKATSNYFYDCNVARPSTNLGVIIEVTSTNISYMNTYVDNPDKLWVTLLYTKTTDTAGSGTWNGQGGLAHHYSTSETVIGTWINGKPLYEITVNIGQMTYDTSFHVVNHGVSDIESVVDVKGSMVLTTSPYRTYPIPTYRPVQDQGILISVNANEIQYINNWQSNAHNTYVTFQYTKTTD